MAEKWQTISELAETTSRQVTQSPEQWRRFLTTAGRFYKAYDFDDQLLIYAQKPDATACADMPTWNNKMRRWVNGGSTAIALVRKGYGGKPYLDYVHDVADTHPVRGGKDPWLWSMDDDSRMPVMERLREVFGAEGGNDLGDLLMDAAAKSVEDTYGDYLTDLIYEKEDSFLEELDDLNIEVTFRDTLRASVQYAVLTRCGLDASRYLDEEDLRGITNFNTIATLACLGTATAQVNRTILLEIGDTIRNIEREKVKKPLAKQEAVAYNDGRNFNTLKRERGDKDGIDIQQTERLSGAEPEMDETDGKAQTLGRFGRAREKYLMEHRKGLYSTMVLNGKLWKHLTEIDKAAQAQVDALMAEMARSQGVNEALKAANQMDWVQKMNNIRLAAEEVVLNDLIYS